MVPGRRNEKPFAADSLSWERLIHGCWDSLVCAPAAILGKGGHLNTHQRSLESIRLFTDCRCNRTKHSVKFNGLDLQAFPKLKRLSWAGVIGDDVYSLSDALAGVARQLEILDLDRSHYQLPRAPRNPDLDSDDDSYDESEYHSLLSKLFRLRDLSLAQPRIIAAFCQNSSLQFLHMRRSGPEFARMARLWKDSRPRKKARPPKPLPRNLLRYLDFRSQSGLDDGPFNEDSALHDRAGKLEHIRADYGRFQEDLHELLQWVSGPRGAHSLHLFLYGDFFFDGRFQDDCKIMCRNEVPDEEERDGDEGREAEPRLYYQQVTKEDRDLLNLLEAEHDFVTACPVDNLFGGVL